MKRISILIFSFSLLLNVVSFATAISDSTSKVIALHLLGYENDQALTELTMRVPDLAKKGVNLIFLEVDYNFEFKSHPELRQSANVITYEGAQYFASVCKKNGIRVVPQFQSLGHQSWAKNTWALLSVYPELDLTPGAFLNNEGIYCREWDPMNPKVNEIIFPMIDEILTAFDADGLHMGLDEVFLIKSEFAKSTKDLNPASVFAKVVNDFHDYFVKKQGKELFMWADRLIDGTQYKYGEWESSMNGTAAAVDSIPKDVVLCDWHYEPMPSYGSIPMFLEKGFKVLPCSYNNLNGVKALIKYSYQLDNPNMLGHMFTTWSVVKADSLLAYEPLNVGVDLIKSGRFYEAQITSKPIMGVEGLSLTMSSPNPEYQIRYTLNGETPGLASSLYSAPVKINSSVTVKATLFEGDKEVGELVEKKYVVHKGIGKDVYYAAQPSVKYTTIDGLKTLVNGIQGSVSYADGQWVGFEGADLEFVIDLGKVTKVSKLRFNSLNDTQSWIHATDRIEVSQSGDGHMYNLSLDKNLPATKGAAVEIVETVLPMNISTRFLKIKVFCKTIPAGFQGAGTKGWLFVDELVVE